jgi:hypothetical protein
MRNARYRTWGLALTVAFLVACAPRVMAQTAVVTVRSINAVIDAGKYGLKMAGHEDKAKEVEGLVSAYLGSDGLKGIDMNRPLGLFVGDIKDKDKPPAVGFVPVSSEQEFIELLGKINVDVTKGQKGVHSIDIPGVGEKVYLRFANSYVYLSDHEANLADALPDPAQLAKTFGRNRLFTSTTRLDQIKEPQRKEIFKEIDNGIERESAKRDNESAAEHQGRLAGMKFVRSVAAAVLNDGKEVFFSLDLDQGKHNFAVDFSLTAKPGTRLADQIQAFASSRSMFGAMAAEAAVHFLMRLPIASELRENLNELMEKSFNDAMQKEQSIVKRALAEKVYKVLEPTLKSDVLDLGAALRGPFEDEKFAVVAAIKVRDGKKIEQLIRDFVKEMQPNERKHVKLDHDKVGDDNVHMIDPPNADPEAKRLFGTAAVYAAFRDDAIFLGLGKHGLDELKKAMRQTKSAGAGAAAPMQLELAVSKLALLNKNDMERAVKAAREAFKDGGQDRVRVTLEGGATLRLHIDISAYLIKFGALMAAQDG